MSAAEVEHVELFDGDEFSLIQDEMASCPTQVVVGCCGRRVGKTWSGSRIVLSWVLTDLVEVADAIERGERDRWVGESLKPTVARKFRRTSSTTSWLRGTTTSSRFAAP